MPILNYTTLVPAEKTIGEITSLLVRKGARSIQSEYCENGQIEGLSFVMQVGGIPVRFQLPSNEEGVLGVMLKEKPFNPSYHGWGKEEEYRAKFKAQANRVSWRILKDWIEAQIALIESGQAEMGRSLCPMLSPTRGERCTSCSSKATRSG